jgi:hypothetical protein
LAIGGNHPHKRELTAKGSKQLSIVSPEVTAETLRQSDVVGIVGSLEREVLARTIALLWIVFDIASRIGVARNTSWRPSASSKGIRLLRTFW